MVEYSRQSGDCFVNAERWKAHMIRNIAVDLGTSNTLIYVSGKGVIFEEPSLITVNRDSNKVVRTGKEAYSVKGRTHDSEYTVRPICDGVISKYRHTLIMLDHFMKKISKHQIIRPSMTVCVPCGISDVEEQAVMDVCLEAGAKSVYLIDAPLASAIGHGFDIREPIGRLVVDIGGGTTDIAVICSGGVVCSDSVKIGGCAMNEALIKYVRRKYFVAISESSAEKAKISAGTVWRRDDGTVADVRGKNLKSSAPCILTLNAADMVEALEEPMAAIVEAVCNVIEQTPPDLVADIAENGILLTGGGSQIYGFDKLIESFTGIKCTVTKKPLQCAVIGAGRAEDLGVKLGGESLSRIKKR